MPCHAVPCCFNNMTTLPPYRFWCGATRPTPSNSKRCCLLWHTKEGHTKKGQKKAIQQPLGHGAAMPWPTSNNNMSTQTQLCTRCGAWAPVLYNTRHAVHTEIETVHLDDAHGMHGNDIQSPHSGTTAPPCALVTASAPRQKQNKRRFKI